MIRTEHFHSHEPKTTKKWVKQKWEEAAGRNTGKASKVPVKPPTDPGGGTQLVIIILYTLHKDFVHGVPFVWSNHCQPPPIHSSDLHSVLRPQGNLP